MTSTPTVHLHEIAEVRMGVTLRGRDATRPDPNGSCRLIRIGDLSDDGELIGEDLLQFEPGEDLKPDHFLRPGDILFPNRGTRTTAYVFDLSLPRVLAGAQFFLLRLDSGQVNPDYLAWFLRTEPAAAHFALRRKGTNVQTLQRADLLELEVPLPCLDRQGKIAETVALGLKERQLAIELAHKKAAYFQRLMLHAANS